MDENAVFKVNTRYIWLFRSHQLVTSTLQRDYQIKDQSEIAVRSVLLGVCKIAPSFPIQRVF